MLDTLGDSAEFVLQHMDVDDLVTISKVSPRWERVLVDNKKQVRRCGVKPAVKFPSLMGEMWVHLYYWRGFANVSYVLHVMYYIYRTAYICTFCPWPKNLAET